MPIIITVYGHKDASGCTLPIINTITSCGVSPQMMGTKKLTVLCICLLFCTCGLYIMPITFAKIAYKGHLVEVLNIIV